MSDGATTAAVQATPRERALGAIDTTVRVAAALGRPDLARELGLVRERLLDPAFTVLIIGEFKQGKSSLVNALLGTAACPVDDDVATAVPTVLRWSDAWTAAVYLAPESGEQDLTDLRTEVPVDQVGGYVTEAANPENVKQVRSVELGLPAPLLQNGLVLVDTPGVGGLAGTHAAITLNALPMADAVLFVSDASQEYSGPELDFLDTARRMCPHVVGLLTKTDFYPEWRKILDLDRGHLRDRDLDFPVLTISSELRRLAVERGDATLNQESGFPALERFLRDDIAARGERIVLDGVRAVAERVVGEVEAQYRAEHEALADPAVQERRLSELAEAEARASAQRQGSARWDVTLADGITDLNRDATHDLDGHLRKFYEESDAAVDGLDPAESREEYEQWLYRRAAEHLAANDEMVRARVAELVARVEAHFVADGGDSGTSVAMGAALGGTMEVEIGSLNQAIARTGEVRETQKRDDKIGTGVAALRGSYGGMMMFGIMGKIIGLALVNPVSLVLGGLLTVRTVKELRKQSLHQRRHTTKIDGQKYIGELALAARKDNGDRLERIRRQLRDRYQQRAREHQEALASALATAKADAKRNDTERTQRMADLEAELRRIAKLRSVINSAFAPDPAGANR
jgi:hypothetical protein